MPNKIYFRNYATTSQISGKRGCEFCGFLFRLLSNTEDMVIIFNIKGQKLPSYFSKYCSHFTKFIFDGVKLQSHLRITIGDKSEIRIRRLKLQTH
jgi:hypothetical protein